MTTLTIQEKGGEKIRLSIEDAQSIAADIGDIITVVDRNTGKRVVGILDAPSGGENGSVEMSRTLFESIGLDVGFPVEVDVYKGELVPVQFVEFGISPDPKRPVRKEDAMITLKRHEREFLNFIGNHVFTLSTRFKWDEHGLVIEIKSTDPPLSPDQVARFGELRDFAYAWTGGEMKRFDGVLLIDVSGSMETSDMTVTDVGWAIERMGGELSSQSCRDFLARFSEGSHVRRFDGAALCALIYLVEKIGRGVGDNIAIVLFSDDSQVVTFNGNVFYSSHQGNVVGAAEAIINGIANTKHNLTMMGKGLETAIEIAKSFDPGRVKMFVVLSDGLPNDRPIIQDILRNRLKPRMDIIINTLGLGARVDEALLENIARATGGQFNRVTGLKDLTRTYSRYALDLRIRGRREVIRGWSETFREAPRAIPECPNCNQPLSFIQQHEKWYCFGCKTYPPVEAGLCELSRTVPTCKVCSQPASYLGDRNSWHCFNCRTDL